MNGNGTNSGGKQEITVLLLYRSGEAWRAIVRKISIQAPLSQRVPAQIALAENIPAKIPLRLTVYTSALSLSRGTPSGCV
jgi:hypothetical protein